MNERSDEERAERLAEALEAAAQDGPRQTPAGDAGLEALLKLAEQLEDELPALMAMEEEGQPREAFLRDLRGRLMEEEAQPKRRWPLFGLGRWPAAALVGGVAGAAALIAATLGLGGGRLVPVAVGPAATPTPSVMRTSQGAAQTIAPHGPLAASKGAGTAPRTPPSAAARGMGGAASAATPGAGAPPSFGAAVTHTTATATAVAGPRVAAGVTHTTATSSRVPPAPLAIAGTVPRRSRTPAACASATPHPRAAASPTASATPTTTAGPRRAATVTGPRAHAPPTPLPCAP